ncbi:ThuA domain-containing protein [Nocardioides plantarum]|uniref:ThuA domain-containing protein n=1 Tax=Nocardioides plantarum TaxID=29299 RepID=A0ABV5KGL2_9ACTN|nr:ThuA domain-containing protein [Nocardioides plantarum]
MNTLITRLRKGSRSTLSSALATIVLLPMGATVGLGLTATAAQGAVPDAVSSPAAATPKTPDAKAKAAKASKLTKNSVPLGKAVPWTAKKGAAARRHDEFDVMVFSKTAAFRHSNIDEGITAIQKLGTENHFSVTVTEDGASFTDANLEQFEAVIFLSTTGDVLTPTQQGAFERYIQGGGGYAGIHAASDTEYDWPWYGQLVGSYFNNHPNGTPTATVKVEDPAHPSTAGIEPRWERTDEWYNFRSNPRGKVHVLASLDETTYAPGGGAMGAEHPIAWCQDYDGGRSWYTGMGHTEASFLDAKFLGHILGGIETAAGVIPSDCKATLEGSFEKVALDENTSNPMELDIADDGRVFYIDRNGAVRIIMPDGTAVTAGTIPVYTGQEFGLLGIALDPNFATNNWVYFYYAPTGSAPIDRIARYTMSGNTLQLNTATTIMDVDVQRNECCHAGGSLEFDHDGNLYLATGDNTNPFDSGGYSPIDERAGRSAWDAQRSAGNTNSLSGKVLRIKPLAAGGYSIPAGNLFDEAADTQGKTRPEIYAMGFRNPFRIGLDEQHDNILVADYGPDAGSVSDTRGPNGRVEWNILDEPGNYGWPYCVGNNTPYNDYNFASSTAGAKFDCANPVNDSPNNTGLTNLPPAKSAVIWQSNNGSITGTPEIGASGAPMTSGTYDYDADLVSDRKWPAYFDSKAIWADWNNSRLFTVQMNQAGTNYTDINRFLPNLPMIRPHALQFGPDGALYMIEWGSGFNGNNTDSGIYRIDYVEGNRAPVARVTTNRTSGPAPLTVNFDGTASYDADTGDATGLTYAWDFDGNGTTDATTATASHTYTTVGNFTARLTVTDEGGRTGTSNIDIVVGNSAPTVELVLPLDGGFFDFGDYLKYEVKVTDAEDGTIDCSKVTVQPGLGHDEHSHGYEQYQGCSGTLALPGDTGHVGANIFGTITASYTDKGAGAANALTGVDGVVVHTKHKEAEFFDETGRTGDNTTGTAGVTAQTTTDSGGGQNVTGVETGDWFRWDMMNLTGITGVTMRAASTTAGATFAVRQGSPTGTTIGTLTVPNTGGAQTYQNVSTTFTGATTTSGALYFVATTGGANVNWLEFAGRGVTDNQPPAVSIKASTLTGEAPLPVSFTSTVTDSENDTPLTYAWDFGDDATSTEADPSHTFTAPGKYTVSLTVTDARGAKTTRTLEVNATRPSTTCFSGRSDDFLGDTLDTDRWNRSVRVDQSLTVSDGSLNVPVTATDIYQTTNTTPNIILQDLPAGAFEATTKLTLPANRSYQQAGLVVYGDDNNYLKLVYSGRSTNPDKSANIIQFAKEVNATASETNSANLGAAFPDTVWLRMTATAAGVVTASYSTDGETFTAMSATRDLTGITAPKVGLLTLGSQAASTGITAKYDYFTLTPDDTATPCAGEGCLESFDGTSLSNTWEVVRPTGNITVGGGNLTIPMAGTDLYQTTNSAGDLVLRDLPAGPFQVVTKVTAPINRQYQQAGLIIYGNDDNYIKLVSQGRSAAADVGSNIVQLTKEVGATATEANTAGLGATFPSTVWLRLTSTDGTAVTGDYSTDGQTWVAMPRGFDLTGIANPRVGVTAFANNAAAATISAAFDSFELTSDGCGPEEPTDTAAPTTTLTIAAADGQAGWYTTRPSFTLAAVDETDGSGIDSTEYRIAGGTWTPYTAAVSVTGEGSRLIEYRSTDKAGNVEAVKSLTVKIDTVVPTVTAAEAGTETKTLTLTAADATSGVARIEFQLDDETTWTVYAEALPFGEPGDHVVRYRAIDVAGNVSAVGTTTVVVDSGEDTTAPKVAATVLGSYDGVVKDLAGGTVGGQATLVSSVRGEGYATTATLTLTGLDPEGRYESHLHIGKCGSFEGHYRDDVDGAGTPPNELWPRNPDWEPTSGDPRIKPEADGTSYASATVPWAPRIEGRSLVLHREGAIVGCADLALTGAGTVVLDATDDVEVTSLTYTVDDGAETDYDGSFEITEGGTHEVAYTATDAAGNETTGTFEVVVPEEPEAPVVTVTTSPAEPNGKGGWYVSPVTVTLKGTGEGTLTSEYRIGYGAWTAYTKPVKLTKDGTTRVQARVRDARGTVSQVVTKTIKIDATAPKLSVSGIANGATMSVAAVKTARVTTTDTLSGIGTRSIRIDGKTVANPVRIDALSLRTGTHKLVVVVTDKAGNSSTRTITFKVVATYSGARALVDRLDKENKVGAAAADKMVVELKAAERADKRGDAREATQALTRFQRLAQAVAHTTARGALVDLARQLKAQV